MTAVGVVEVLRGDGPDGLTWRILAGGSQDDFATFVERGRGHATATSGFRGPKLYPGQVTNAWIGQADEIPPFITVRAAAEVTRTVAVCASGRNTALAALSTMEPGPAGTTSAYGLGQMQVTKSRVSLGGAGPAGRFGDIFCRTPVPARARMSACARPG